MRKAFRILLGLIMLTICIQSNAQVDTSTTQKLLQYVFQPIEWNNTGKSISQIQIDFANGQGFQAVTVGTAISISSADTCTLNNATS